MSLPLHLLICVTFHYVESRLQYVRAITARHPELADRVDLRVVTNASTQADLARLRAALPGERPGFRADVHVAPPLEHPYFLTWVHKDIFRQAFSNDPTITHFLYVEDDMKVTRENVDYWMRSRERLRPHGLIPSFFRIELCTADGLWKSTDLRRPVVAAVQPSVRFSSTLKFLNLPNPYQAVYLFDRELMAEHLSGPASTFKHQWDELEREAFGHRYADEGGIRERAAWGQTFLNVPPGFHSRNVVPYNPRAGRLHHECYIRHLPANYANHPEVAAGTFGSVEIENGLFDSGPEFFAHPLGALTFLARHLWRSRFARFAKWIQMTSVYRTQPEFARWVEYHIVRRASD